MLRGETIGAALLVSVLLMPSSTAAQLNTGNIAGVVRDTTGAVLPGVTVEAASTALIEKVRSVATDDQGQYRIIDLRPGTYTVTFTLAGFRSLKREGLELAPSFTATVNAELSVGGIEESVTVSGASPVVDVHNVTQKATFSRQVLDAIPTSRSNLGQAALVPAAIIPPNNQDVGGSKGEPNTRMAFHGAKATEMKLSLDGMRYNVLSVNGSGRSFYLNPASTEQIVLGLVQGGSAEVSTGGVQVNLVPKDGGNRYTGYLYTTYMNDKLQSNNFSQELRDRGLRSVNSIREIYDINGAAGGPLKADRLWFYTSVRKWGQTIQWANHYRNATPNTLLYTADLNEPTEPFEDFLTGNLRLAFQATQKQKLTFYGDTQDIQQPAGPAGSSQSVAIDFDALQGRYYPVSDLYQGTWTYAASSRMLFEAGSTLYRNRTDQTIAGVQFPSSHGAPNPDAISVLEQTTNFRYGVPQTFGWAELGQSNHRVSGSYITGSHNAKIGFFALYGTSATYSNTNPYGLSFTFSNGRPISLTETTNPTLNVLVTRPDIGIFAQDQWTMNRLTVNVGIRYEYFRSVVPASEQAATALINARRFEEVDCVPCWHDISPRFAAAYDLFGKGKTAVKASIGRYVRAQTNTLAGAVNPVVTSVNSVNRSWNDLMYPAGDPRRGNFWPDCDLRNPELNGECGRMSNINFGQTNITTIYDPEVLRGWHKREYNWQSSIQLDQELWPGVGLNVGYFRTWYGNFLATDNLEVTPADYDPYCITTPSNAMLLGGGSQQVCGLYNLRQDKFGRVNNFVTFASKYGEQTETYNGVDININARLPRGAMVAGGVNIGNFSSFGDRASTSRCFVVDSPQELYQCDKPLPYQPQFKMLWSIPLPQSFQLAGNFQSVPGYQTTALWNVPAALITPSLGRAPSGNAATLPLELLQVGDLSEERINQLDIRFSRIFRIRALRVTGNFDVYNALNANPVVTLTNTYGPNWRVPTQILDARLFKWGVTVEF